MKDLSLDSSPLRSGRALNLIKLLLFSGLGVFLFSYIIYNL